MNNSFTQRPRSRLWHAIPVNVLNLSAVIANKVMMPRPFDIEARGTAFDSNLTNQPRLHKVAQIVISSGPRGTRIETIDALEDLSSSRMARVFDQKRHHAETLRRTPQTALLQTLHDRLRVHPKLDYV